MEKPSGKPLNLIQKPVFVTRYLDFILNKTMEAVASMPEDWQDIEVAYYIMKLIEENSGCMSGGRYAEFLLAIEDDEFLQGQLPQV